ILWGIFNYLYHQPNLNSLTLVLLKTHLFFALWYTFFTFNFLYIYPNKKFYFPNWYKYFLIPVTFCIAILTLTPLVFEKIIYFTPDNKIGDVKTGPGMILFGLFIFLLLVAGILNYIINFIKRRQIINNVNKLFDPSTFLFIGIIVTFFLHIIFNLILPNVFKNTQYTILGPIFTFPFIFLSAYSILRFNVFNVRIVFTEIFIFVLLVASLFQILIGNNLYEILIRFFIFILIFVFSILLIRGTRREIEQKEELQRLNLELERANRLKSEFLSFASHQLKSPMAVIKGYISLMIDGTIPNVPDQVKDFAFKIKKSIDDLLTLIEEFMDYRKIDENKMDFNFEAVEIVGFIKEIFENYKLIAKERNLEFSFESNISEAKVNIDKIRFAQVIQNLIDNALKYTKQGFVRVGLNKKDNNILICVKDSGIGISKELQANLFNQFVREQSIKKEIQGTGLGLYIAKYIIENHKGKIWAESEGENKGSQFCIEIQLLNN
ncbi:MAG: sensor histidine kinase, partial [Minisyncoccia bacterium]